MHLSFLVHPLNAGLESESFKGQSDDTSNHEHYSREYKIHGMLKNAEISLKLGFSMTRILRIIARSITDVGFKKAAH